MTPKPKKCRNCTKPFVPSRPMQVVCTMTCALKHLRKREKEQAKERRAQKRAGLERLMTVSDWKKRAQKAVNAWVRLRDAHLPCISCGTTDAKWDAGHYRSVGACPELRFEPLNIHKQCAQCNSFRSGNVIEYRINLLRRVGPEVMEWLEGPHEPKKYTIPDLKAIEAKYKALAKELKEAA